MNEEKTLRRVLRVSAFNGGSVTALGAVGLLIAGLSADFTGIVVGIAVTAAGVMELVGRAKVKARSLDCGKWLAGSQLWLLATIACYCLYQVWSFDPTQLGALESLRDPLGETIGLDAAALNQQMRAFSKAFYLSVVAIAFLYQGGLGLYYMRAAARLNAAPASGRGQA